MTHEMKAYRNERHGFEIDVPEEWSLPTGATLRTPFGESIIFGCGVHEAFNVQVGPLGPEPPLDETEQEFRRYAQEKWYGELEVWRITVGGRDHAWARYRIGFRDWTKKYMIALGETEYAITATCFDQQAFAEKERIWDVIATSFRLLPHTEARTVGEIEGVVQAG